MLDEKRLKAIRRLAKDAIKSVRIRERENYLGPDDADILMEYTRDLVFAARELLADVRSLQPGSHGHQSSAKTLFGRLRNMARRASGEDAEVLEWACEHIEHLERAIDVARITHGQLSSMINAAPPSATGAYGSRESGS